MIHRISVLVDNDSWILPFAEQLVSQLLCDGYQVVLCRGQKEIPEGDVCFFLGCTKIVSDENLKKNTHNLVVHESDLPKGKGFAPVAWQILEGSQAIPVCLIEACTEADAGDIWLRDFIVLNGTELCSEWREKQGEVSIRLALKFVNDFDSLTSICQSGKSSFYPRRTPKDSELDIHKTIAEQFPLMKTVDNIDYPAFFVIDGQKYKLAIEKIGE